jgi:HSP20 family protein
MSVIRWDPFRFGIRSIFDDSWANFGTSQSSPSTWAPPVDIHETDNSFVVFVELPGMKREDIALEVKDNTLSVRGERRQEKETSDEGVHRLERAHGTFYRAFSLPANVNTSEVKASYKDGVLEITLPKEERAKSRQIDIAA